MFKVLMIIKTTHLIYKSMQEFFDRHPEVLTHFDKFSAIEIDSVKVSEALRMHASRVLAIVEDIVDNTGNPDKIRSIMQDLGRNHHQQVRTQFTCRCSSRVTGASQSRARNS